MKHCIRIIDRISGFGGFLAGAMLCIGVALVMGEIILRTGFSRTLYVTEEYSGYLMAMLTFCALGYTLRERGHIRMTFLHKVVTGRPRICLDMACYLIGFSFCMVLLYFTSMFFWDSVVSGSRSMQISRTYLAFPQAFLPFGSLILALQFLGEFLRSIAMLRGDTEGIAFPEDKENQGR